MKRALLACILLAAALAAPAAHAGAFDRLERGPMPRLAPPPVHTEVLPNGVRLFVLEDRALPMVQMVLITRGGRVHDPQDKAGLGELAGMLLRSGGAGGMGPEEFDEKVDALGVALSSSVGSETGEFGLMVLSEDLKEGLSLLFDMVLRPGLDEKRLSVARGKIEEGLRRENDDPGTVAARRFRAMVYGKDSPWARRPTKRSLSKIGVADIRGFLDRYMRTGNMIIAASGDFDKKEFISMIREMTEGAPAGEAELPGVEEVELAFEPEEETVARQLTQSFIRMGHLGIRRHNPDAYALRLMSEIFGAGAFKSRLMEDIRTVRGMAYSIWGDLTEGTDYGLFVIGVNTKADDTPEVIDLIRGHVKRLAVDGDVTDEELDFARRSVLSGLIFNFDRPIKVALSRAHYHLYGYPDDYWRVFTEGISGVTRQDVKEVAGRYIHPDGLKVVVVGPKGKGKGKER